MPESAGAAPSKADVRAPDRTLVPVAPIESTIPLEADPEQAIHALGGRSASASAGSAAGSAGAGAPPAGPRATTVRPADLLALQRLAGNGAVAAIARRPARPAGVPRATLQRDPTVPDATVKTSGGKTGMKLPPDPVALEVLAGGIDEAAAILAEGIKDVEGDAVIFGLQPTFMIVYGKDGKRISTRIALEFPKGTRPAPGVYVIPPEGGVSRRVMKDPESLEWSLGQEAGVVTDIDPKKAKAGPGDTKDAVSSKVAPPAPPAGTGATTPATGTDATPSTPPPPPVYDLRKFMKDTSVLEAAVAGHEKAMQYFVVPSHPSGTKGKKGGGETTGFSGELSEGGSGPPPNAPPWPVRLDGPKMQPTDSTGTFDAKIDWSANGNSSLSGQVISAVGNDIHYRWEVFDVTAYAKKHAEATIAQAKQTQAMIKAVEDKGVAAEAGDAKLVVAPDPTATQGAPATTGGGGQGGGGGGTGAAPGPKATGAGDVGDVTPPPVEDDYDAQLERMKTSKAGSGEEETGASARNKAFKDDFRNLWKDTARAGADIRDRKGDTYAEKESNLEANLINLQLFPVSALITTLGASLRWVADLFAGERKQMEIPWEHEGTFLVRVITTPSVGSDREGNAVIRPSSVGSVVVEVVKTERMVKEALDAPGAELSEAESALAKAQHAKNPDQGRIDDLQKQVELKRLEASGDPLALLDKKIELKELELIDVKRRTEGVAVGPILKVENELDILKNRRDVYKLQESRRTDGDTTAAPPTRLNASLISEVTGQTYPLLISAGPMPKSGTQHHWKVLDATSQDSEGFDGYGITESAALKSALDKFGEKAQYGRGTIGVRIPDTMALEKGALRDLRIVSQPAGWAIARGRIDDLVMTLAALGLFVASAGTAAAVIGAAVAAARLIERLHNGTLRLDGAAVSDALAILGGAGVLAQAASAMRLQRLGKAFVMMEEGGAGVTELQKAATILQGAGELAKLVEVANEAINYAGLLWGNLSFIDQMMDIAAQEASGSMTHAEARRQRAMAIGGAVNNNAMFVAANAIHAHEQAQAGKKGGGAPPREGGTGGGTHEGGSGGGTHEGGTGGTTHEGGTGAPKEGRTGETGAPKPTGEGGETGAPKPTGEGGTPAVKGGGAGGETKPTGSHDGGGVGVGAGGGGAPGDQGGTSGRPAPKPTAKEVQTAAHKALQDAAHGTGDLQQAAGDALGKGGTWKEDLKGAVGKLEGPQREAAEKALVDARDKLVNDTWEQVKAENGYQDLRLENAGTKSFGSDIDATVRPVNEASATGADMGDQVKRAGEAAQKLSEALRGKVGGETDAAIDTNIYSFIGEGRVTPGEAAGKGAQQHVDMVVGLAEQLRGQNEQQFKAFEQRLGKKLQSGEVGAEAKALLGEARKFHDARQGEWTDARAKAKQEHPNEPQAVTDRRAREDLLGQKKAELGSLLAAPQPDYAAISGKQAEINWFAPDAYATPSAFKQAVAHGQRLRGSQRTAGEMTGGEVSGKLRDAAAKLPPESPRAQKLARDAALVESQQRLLDMTVKELAREQEQTPMDAARVRDLEQRAAGLKQEIAKAAEPIVIGEILGSTMPADRPGPERLSEAAAASGANLGMLEDHVSHAKDADGKVKAACKYGGRIAMAEFLGGLRPSSEPIARLIGEFVKSRMGVFEDPPAMILRDMFLRYAELTGRTGDIVNNDAGAPIGVTDGLKAAFVDDVKGWARSTNDEIQAAAIGAKAFDNPTVPVSPPTTSGGGEEGGGTGPKPGGGGGGPGGGATGGTTKPAGEGSTKPVGEGGAKPAGEEGVKPATTSPGAVTSAGGVIGRGGTPVINPPGVNKPFDFRLGSLAEGHAALRQLSRGDGSILAANGVTLPADYQSHGREFGLARLPDGTFAIVQGEVGGVEWSSLPTGSEPLAHTHPMVEGRQLNRPGTVGEIATRVGQMSDDGPSPETLDRVHVFPSAADLRFCAANKVVNHDVHTPYVHTGDGVLKTPTGAPNERPVSFNIFESTHVGNIGTQPVMEASIVAHDAEGNVLFMGRMWAVEIAGDSMLSFEPISSMSPPDPKTLEPSRIGYKPPEGGGEGGAGGADTEAGRTTGAGGSTKAGTTGAEKPGGIPGGVTVENDGYAIWVKAKKDPNALVRIEVDGNEILVKDIYRRELPEGSGSLMLAEGFKAAQAKPGSDIIVGEVLNPPTKAAHDRGDPPNGTPLGKTTERALAAIGLTVKSMEWVVRRGKLTIVVKVG